MNNAEISKCLAEVSALVDAGHPYEKCVQSRFSAEGIRKYGSSAGWSGVTNPNWTDQDFEFRVAKGFVEGKPVFENSVLYDTRNNSKLTIVETDTGKFVQGWNYYLTWTPPAPKVEIPEGFTAWHGGEGPVDGSRERSELIFRSGNRVRVNNASWKSWQHTGGKDDIIAYKVHKPTTFELNGEVLPLPDCVVDIAQSCPFGGGSSVRFGIDVWWYKSKTDADKIRAAFAKLVEGL